MRANLASKAKHLGGPLLGKALVRSHARSDEIRTAIGAQRADSANWSNLDSPQDAEFKVFSQWGEDGILQYLVNKVPIMDDAFVEIGVEDYAESNTRFLLVHDDWRGLIFDAGHQHIDFLEWSSLRWRHSIEAHSIFVTRENVNAAIANAGFAGDIGLLSIDIDGIDYWLVDAITVAMPRILVVEYNSLFGAELPITVPYDARFDQRSAHWSRLYYGASLSALNHVAARKGYSLVASNSAGCNAFFVRNDLMEPAGLRPLSPAQAYVASRFRSSRDEAGQLTYVDSHAERLALIKHLPVVDVITGSYSAVGDLIGL